MSKIELLDDLVRIRQMMHDNNWATGWCAVISSAISAIQENIDPPENTIPARIAFVVDAEDRRSLVPVELNETDQHAMAQARRLTSYWVEPTIEGIILAHLPRPQSVEVQGTVETKAGEPK